MAASSSLTLCQSAFPSTRQLSPSMELSSLPPQHFLTLKPWNGTVARKTKVPAIIPLEKRIAGVGFTVSTSYTKRPMETPGAYELIDKESGERIIVCGGDDDDDSSIPSKHVLPWNPKSQEQTTTKTKERSPGTKGKIPMEGLKEEIFMGRAGAVYDVRRKNPPPPYATSLAWSRCFIRDGC